jgi:hypothetical protein
LKKKISEIGAGVSPDEFPDSEKGAKEDKKEEKDDFFHAH